MERHVIYGLHDPRDKRRCVRYVGYTGHSVARRLQSHLRQAREGQRGHRSNWIRCLLASGVLPVLSILEEVNLSTWQARERFWIDRLSNLTNATAGGEGLVNPSPDVRRRIAESVKRSPSSFKPGNTIQLGAHHTKETRGRISTSLKASEAFHEAHAARRGIPISDEQKRAISKFQKGRPKSIEHRRKIGRANRGNKSCSDYKWVNNGKQEFLILKFLPLPAHVKPGRISLST